jgi:hypothetical protein
LRTKRLFLLVLDAHHQYQCLRLELLPECLRFEAEEKDDVTFGDSQLQLIQTCLNDFDATVKIQSLN